MVNLAASRSTVRPKGAVLRTVLLSLIGVVGVVAGLLSMHTLSVDAPIQTPVAAVAPAEHHDAGVAFERPATSDECGPSGCEPLHVMGLMACVLALLLVSLVAAPYVSRWYVTLRVFTRLSILAHLAAAPPPPSLVALSISRT